MPPLTLEQLQDAINEMIIAAQVEFDKGNYAAARGKLNTASMWIVDLELYIAAKQSKYN